MSALREAADGKLLDEHKAGRVFEALGINGSRWAVIEGPGEPIDLHYPVAVKLLSSQISHKSDVGGVILDLGNRESVDAACREISARLAQRSAAAGVQGFLVQEMVSGLAETLVSFHRDPEVGPVVTLGVGGTLAELYRDFAVRVAPVSVNAARAMLDEVKGLAGIRGYRGMPRGDCQALAKAVSALSQLAAMEGPQVLEAEINPLVVMANHAGVVAVDGVVKIQAAG